MENFEQSTSMVQNAASIEETSRLDRNQRPINPILLGKVNMETYLIMKEVLYPKKPSMFQLQQLCSLEKTPLSARTASPYYCTLTNFTKSGKYKDFEASILQDQTFSKYFFKGEPKYNQQVLATLTFGASTNMERQILTTQSEINNTLLDQPLRQRKAEELLELEEQINQLKAFGIPESDFVPPHKHHSAMAKMQRQQKQLDNMIASGDCTEIEKLMSKSVGYCDFKFTDVFIDRDWLYIKVVFLHKYTVHPETSFVLHSEMMPSNGTVKDALLYKRITEVHKECTFKMKLNLVKFGQRFEQMKAICQVDRIIDAHAAKATQTTKVCFAYGFGRNYPLQEHNIMFEEVKNDAFNQQTDLYVSEHSQSDQILTTNHRYQQQEQTQPMAQIDTRGLTKFIRKAQMKEEHLISKGQVGTQFKVAGYEFEVCGKSGKNRKVECQFCGAIFSRTNIKRHIAKHERNE